MKRGIGRSFLVLCLLPVIAHLAATPSPANPWNGKVVFQAFWWDCWTTRHPQDWYTYLATLAPRLRELGFDGLWIPSPVKGNSGTSSMGYDIFDHYDLGDKDQKGTVATRFGTQDSLLRLIAIAHANGLEVYPDIVLNHTIGGEEDPAAPGDRFKRFRYPAFAGPEAGRWPKDHWNFHPNPDHWCTSGDWCEQSFGPDMCYLDGSHGGGNNGRYMRDKAREWFVWLTRQLGVDGYRFDAVKHYPAYVIEDLLFNAKGDGIEYFAVGEYVGGGQQLDGWVAETRHRCGTFDFGLRDALANLVEAGGFFDMSRLPSFQQGDRTKTVPFINNHDTWRGAHWDSEPGSLLHDDRSGDWRMSGAELAPTIDPDNPRADVAYAAAFAVDGSPMVFYEDLFVNNGTNRFQADAVSLETRNYLVNLVWAHQKLNFKDGAYKVRHQGSQDLLIIERSARAIIGLNDHGSETLEAWIKTDFNPGTRLHDYSGSTTEDRDIDSNGWVKVTVPPMSYVILGPAGVEGGFDPAVRRTTQEFQLDDDLGDLSTRSPGHGGRLRPGSFQTAGDIYAASHSTVRLQLYTDGTRRVQLRVHRPDAQGGRATQDSFDSAQGDATNESPLTHEFVADREGYYSLSARLTSEDESQSPTRGYLKVQYEGPRILRTPRIPE